MTTLIGTIFSPDERNPVWYELQRHFIEKNTEDFEHAVVLNRIKHKEIFKDSKAIRIEDKSKYPEEYYNGIESIFRYWSLNSHHLDSLLILDSDAWPVMKDWDKFLYNELQKRNRWYAAPVRYENYDSYPHVCAVFIRKDSIALANDFLNFRPVKTRSLAGPLYYEDTGVGNKTELTIEQWGEQEILYPLIKTNAYSPHPVLGSIYSDLFYHHGAGSRSLALRAVDYGMTNHFILKEKHADIEREMFEMLKLAPDSYIEKLMNRSLSWANLKRK